MLKLNPDKCAFAQVKVKYLGNWFSGEGYGMDPKMAVRSFKEIKNGRQAKRWLGLCGYYRKVCEGYSDIVAHSEIGGSGWSICLVQRSGKCSRNYG